MREGAEGGGGGIVTMHGRSLQTINPGISTMLGRSTSGVDLIGKTSLAPSAQRGSVSGKSDEGSEEP